MEWNLVRKEIVILVVLLFLVGFVPSPSWGALQAPSTDECLPTATASTTGSTGCGGTSKPTLRLLSQISTVNSYGTGYVFDMDLAGNRLSTANIYYNPVFDVSNPSFPSLAYELEHGYGTGRAIKMVGNKYYTLATGGMFVWDISGASPVYLGMGAGGSRYTHDFEIVNNKAYIVSSVDEEQTAGRSGYLEIWDISHFPANSMLGAISLGEYCCTPFPPYAHGIVMEGNRAFVGMEGLMSINTSDPASPTITGRLDVRNPYRRSNSRSDTEGIYGGFLFNAQDAFGILVINMFYWDYPTLYSVVGSPTLALGDLIAFEVAWDQKRIFVATAKDKQFKVLDITNLNNVKVLGATSISDLFDATPGTDSLEVELDTTRGLAFVAGEGKLNIYDVKDFLP